ncbi:MAG TPA: hypothetical protein VKK79_24100 [Candidatus Lokiarchaeia archaeon]|nr:hypothetical protein [Candidatus Lokiarchaeia archaeon]
MDDVPQDRLSEGLFALLDGDRVKYVKIKKLSKVQEDLYQLFNLAKWLGLYYGCLMMLGHGFTP